MLEKAKNSLLVKMVLLAVIVMTISQCFSPAIAIAAESHGNKINSESVYKDKNANQSFGKMMELANNSSEIKDSEKTEEIKNFVNRDISNENILLNSSNANLDLENATFLNITKNSQNYTSISIPISGEGYSLISNLTVVYGESNELVSFSETLITKSSSDKFIISSYIDGQLIQSNKTNIDYISDNEIQKGLDGLKADAQKIETRGIGAIAGCIAAVAGVNGVVAYLIAGTCIASCPAVVPICVACIGAVATIGAADIGAVIACFNL
ncbi:hypothetical protein ATZ33_06670 [Enterococcus silesiacus]|uniref:Bacteriocin n=1 Tax=Enterococcus silesiacus TaxID=332949 RepID=A0A0S3K9Q3_9ENTE|nr:hypothetical protein [Enterococcus silesiacus]ALS01062.1 hypothetical protein ATZ33_06670 [Enterococcus silesiacus]OJG91712.1 hypothetical protein RV15_GL000379 [Enterococcus silesiacus]